ncbi:hypothetical protein RHECNPAF_730072 [Rhizobium etli CNPAF512]|nr:hypothetical protein RHECNPAF_730072 [Rhizobium etli CNPAF512]
MHLIRASVVLDGKPIQKSLSSDHAL